MRLLKTSSRRLCSYLFVSDLLSIPLLVSIMLLGFRFVRECRAQDEGPKEYPLRIATFQTDVTPPLGSPSCFGFVRSAKQIDDPLSARGMILLTNEKPIVLCVIDWVALANGAHDASAPPFYHDKLNLMHYIDENQKEHAVRSIEDWQKRRTHILKNFELVAGTLPGSERKVPLDVRFEKIEQLEGYVRKKLTFATESNDRVRAYLLVPNGVKYPVPAVLCLHQTTSIGSREPAGLGGSADLHYAAELAERGYVTLAPDYPYLGENRFDPYKNGYVSCTMKGIWNHMRAIDLLQSLPEVDGRRIGVIGHSLGGHNSLFLAAYDDRVRCVVTCCGYTTNEAYFQKMKSLPGGTINLRYFPRIDELTGNKVDKATFDLVEIAAATAPRPLLTVAPLRDSNFPVEGVKNCMRSLKPLYKLHEAEDHLVFDFPKADHTFPPASRKKAYAWFDRWLK